jgi:hypothetical protein
MYARIFLRLRARDDVLVLIPPMLKASRNAKARDALEGRNYERKPAGGDAITVLIRVVDVAEARTRDAVKQLGNLGWCEPVHVFR